LTTFKVAQLWANDYLEQKFDEGHVIYNNTDEDIVVMLTDKTERNTIFRLAAFHLRQIPDEKTAFKRDQSPAHFGSAACVVGKPKINLGLSYGVYDFLVVLKNPNDERLEMRSF
jgi:hypothetical protein